VDPTTTLAAAIAAAMAPALPRKPGVESAQRSAKTMHAQTAQLP
jgi:hypothetical protein